MVRALHAAGIEVILDVVYNHTAEGDAARPDAVACAGIDNAAYYRLAPTSQRYYENYTGCGNTLEPRHPRVLQMVTRLAALLGRGDARRRLPLRPRAGARPRRTNGFDRDAPLLRRAARRTRSLSHVKLIAEPGTSAPAATSWAASRPAGANGTTASATRARRSGAASATARRELAPRAHRLERHLPPPRPAAARQHQFRHLPRRLHARRPGQLQRQAQRGQRRGQPRRHADNRSWNCGVEGPTDDPEVARAARSGRSATCWPRCCSRRACRCCWPATSSAARQRGNNNAYCQDNEISWLDWNGRTARRPRIQRLSSSCVHRAAARSSGVPARYVLQRAVRKPAATAKTSRGHRPAGVELRRDHPAFQRDTFFSGRPQPGSDRKDIAWYTPGVEMTGDDWGRAGRRGIGVFFGDRPLFAVLLQRL